MNSIVYHPDYIRIFERKPGQWRIKLGELFYSKIPFRTDMLDFKLLYSITKQEIAIELFKINGGKLGYYLADLRNKKFYYCGEEVEGIRNKLLELGIGRKDPTAWV